MKKDNMKYVPSNKHPGCSLAETGLSDYDDFDNPLKPLDIIPKGKEKLLIRTVYSYKSDGEYYEDVFYKLPSEINSPSQVREEFLVSLVVPLGMHPFTFLKEKGVDITNAWIFMNEELVEKLRQFPNKFHQPSVAYGEFFRFESGDSVSLQSVEYFKDWKVLLNWEIDGKKFIRNDMPGYIIEMVMEK